MNNYYAVVRTGQNDELKHFKYIKRVKKNGKWRYFYDQAEADKYDKGKKEQYTEKDGTSVTKEYKNSNNLLSYTTTISNNSKFTMDNGKTKEYKTRSEVYEQGKIGRIVNKTIAKGEKHVYNRFFKNNKPKKISSIKKYANKGHIYIKKLFNKK